jgi:hypothetical protein
MGASWGGGGGGGSEVGGSSSRSRSKISITFHFVRLYFFYFISRFCISSFLSGRFDFDHSAFFYHSYLMMFFFSYLPLYLL